MWNLPGLGIEPMYPVLAGGFLSTVPPGKSSDSIIMHPRPRWFLRRKARTLLSQPYFAICYWITCPNSVNELWNQKEKKKLKIFLLLITHILSVTAKGQVTGRVRTGVCRGESCHLSRAPPTWSPWQPCHPLEVGQSGLCQEEGTLHRPNTCENLHPEHVRATWPPKVWPSEAPTLWHPG